MRNLKNEIITFSPRAIPVKFADDRFNYIDIGSSNRNSVALTFLEWHLH